ncbi:MAG: branched-subunit amino acid transport protein [Paracoccaceae bacterium]|jgi:branched-subunit amino acid transport protein
MIPESTNIWLVIVLLAVGSFLIRFSFLGLVGGRELPEWALRHLRYVAVAVMPGLIAPAVVWPAATDGNLDPARLLAALIAFGVGMWFRSVIGAVFSGMIALYGFQFLLG